MTVGKSVLLERIKIFLKAKLCTNVLLSLCAFCPFYLAIVGTLEAEKDRRKSGLSSRVQFRNQGSEPKYTKELTLNRQKQKACMEETLWLQVRPAAKPVS